MFERLQRLGEFSYILFYTKWISDIRLSTLRYRRKLKFKITTNTLIAG